MSPRFPFAVIACRIAAVLALAMGGPAPRAGAQTCAPPPPGMFSWWPGEGDATDIQGDNDGALQNGATFAPGHVGQAFSFDGMDDQIVVPHDVVQNVGAEITIDTWIYRSSAGHGRTIAQKRSPGNVGGYMFETTDSPYGPNNGMQFFLWIGGVPRGLISGPDIVSLNTWHHVAATYDGTTMRIHVDGVERASMPMSGPINASTEPMVIGRNPVIPSFTWHGFLDEIHLFDRALSAPEIQAIHAAGTAGICAGSTAAVMQPRSIPGVVLSQNYPNPFHPETVVAYELPAALEVRLAVYDAAGRLVRSLASGMRPSGAHSVSWDGTDDRGKGVSAGVYFYRLQAGSTAVTRRMVMLN